MKKLILLAVFLLTACSSTTKNIVPAKKSTISVQRFVSTCGTPIESYFVAQLGVKVHRHKNCMDIDDLLSLVWAGNMSQQNVDGVALLAVMYAAHISKIDPDANYLVNLIKIDSFTQNDLETHIAFFKIKRKVN